MGMGFSSDMFSGPSERTRERRGVALGSMGLSQRAAHLADHMFPHLRAHR